MPSRVYSAAVVGVEAFEVEIEVHAGWGNTDKIAVVGLPDTAVKESKDRVTSAICNSGLRWPYGQRITINLAPADVRKEGPSFDLPIAMATLKLEENNRLPDLDRFYMSGELALSGQLRPIKGVLSIALEARRRQRQTLIVPLDNAAEAAVVEGVDVYGAGSLSEVVQFLRGEISLEPVRSTNDWSEAKFGDQDLDFGEVKGQQHVKRAVEVAAARRAQYSHHRAYSVRNVGELRLLRRAAGQRDLKRTSRGISDLLIGYAWEQKAFYRERYDDVPVDITVSSVNI